jgi:hypothetical protein
MEKIRIKQKFNVHKYDDKTNIISSSILYEK